MTKQQFLISLKNELSGLPTQDINQSLDYYSEMIDDRMDDGLSEDAAVIGVGDPKEIAAQILMETPMTKLVKAKARLSRTLQTWEIVLLAAGSPVWLSLAVAAAAVVLAIYIVLGAVIVSLYAVVAALGLCAVAGIVGAVASFVFAKIPQGFAIMGAGFVLAGLTILLFIVFNLAVKYLVISVKKLWFLIKGCFIRKGESNENC